MLTRGEMRRIVSYYSLLLLGIKVFSVGDLCNSLECCNGEVGGEVEWVVKLQASSGSLARVDNPMHHPPSGPCPTFHSTRLEPHMYLDRLQSLHRLIVMGIRLLLCAGLCIGEHISLFISSLGLISPQGFQPHSFSHDEVGIGQSISFSFNAMHN